MSSPLSRELLFHTLQFLDEEKFNVSLHKLEQESGLYFNMKYFEEIFLGGEWDEVEKYVSGFTKIDDNRISMMIYFEIRKHKYLEALTRQDRSKAVEIMVNELEMFSKFNEGLGTEMTQLLTLNDIRANEKLSCYVDTKAARSQTLIELKKLIECNPLIREKLTFPTLETSRLRALIHQSTDNPSTLDDTMKPIWQLTEVVELSDCRMLTMPDYTNGASKVGGLLYTHNGDGLLALGCNGVHKFWKWACTEQNPSGKASVNYIPRNWRLRCGRVMQNDILNVNLQEAIPCIAISKNDSYVVSAMGGKVSLFNLLSSQVMTTFMAPKPASTFISFHPQDNNIIAVGMEDSTIIMYNVKMDQVITRWKAHRKRVTGLAFSTRLNLLVSSGADAQLCGWSIDSGYRRKSDPVQLYAGKESASDTRTQVEFGSDSVCLLVYNETQLAIYDASKMDRLCQWVPQDVLSAPITSAAYSSKSLLVYASFFDGNVGVFDADTLMLRCRVSPTAYLSRAGSNQYVYPLVIATHPHHQNQFAIGLSDGYVTVIEPAESEGEWGEAPTTASSASSSNH